MIAEIIGIPGSGKTYYLNKLKCGNAKCIDFGSELKKWLKSNNKSFTGDIPPQEYIKEFIDSLYAENNDNIILTSHVAHYKDGNFLYDLDSEIYANADLHIFVYSEPSEILRRRQKDCLENKRRREVGTLDSIKRHQDLSLKLTKELSKQLSSKFILIENTHDKEFANLSKINEVLFLEKNPNERYFDRWADGFYNLPNENSFHLGYVGNLIKKEYPNFFGREKLNVMELGIGNGRFFEALNIIPKQLIGIDISKKQLGLASKKFSSRGYNFSLIQRDMENNLPIEDSSIDLVMSNASLHHIKNKINLFKEIYRTLKVGGKFVFFDFYFGEVDSSTLKKIELVQKLDHVSSVKFIDSIREEHNLMPESLEGSHPEEFHISPVEIKNLLSKAGFENCKIIPTFYPKYIGVAGEK